jgi:hypothetical protein
MRTAASRRVLEAMDDLKGPRDSEASVQTLSESAGS